MNYAKAIVSGIVAALSFAVPVVDDGLLASEILGIVLAGLIGSGITYAVPNRDPQGRHQAESVQPPERGATDLVAVLVVVVLIVVLLLLFGVLPTR